MQFYSPLLVLLSIQLVERFYDPLSGDILLDGLPISEFNVQEYRKHLALVSQEPVSIYHQ
jgi:ABC-type multidrug transport system fused ATPase/permease subunit